MNPPGLLILPHGSKPDDQQQNYCSPEDGIGSCVPPPPSITGFRELSCHQCLCSCPSLLQTPATGIFQEEKPHAFGSQACTGVIWGCFKWLTFGVRYKATIWKLEGRESIWTLPTQKVAKILFAINKALVLWTISCGYLLLEWEKEQADRISSPHFHQ